MLFIRLFALALTDWQFWLVTFVLVPLLGEVYKVIVTRFGFKPSKTHVMVALSVISLALAAAFNLDLFRGLPAVAAGFLTWLGALLAVIGELIGLAKVIYDLVYDRVFDWAAKKGLGLLAYRLK